VGYIVGANVGAVMLGGGIIAWNIAIPIYAVYFLDGNPELAKAVAGLSATDAAATLPRRAEFATSEWERC